MSTLFLIVGFSAAVSLAMVGIGRSLMDAAKERHDDEKDEPTDGDDNERT